MTTPPDDKPRRSLVAIGVIVAGVAAIGLGLTALLLFSLHIRQQEPQARSNPGDRSSVQSDVDSPNPAKPAPVAPLPVGASDFSTSNVVSILLGQENDEDGLRHLADEADGRTTIETLDGVLCRCLNRKPRNFGYLYFAIHPDFKRDELKAARVEIEYRVASTVLVRLQYDGTEGELHKRYKSAPPSGAEMSLGAGTRYTVFRESNQWQTATFDITEGVFMNSQNGGADFRLEASPPEIYVRRVSVSRPAVQTPAQQTNR